MKTIAIVLLIGGLLMASEPVMIADVDTEPPELIGFDFSPRSANVGLVDQWITFTFRITDDRSGFSHAQMNLDTDAGGEGGVIIVWPAYRVSGNELDGVYECKLVIRRFREPHIRIIRDIRMFDVVGNIAEMTRDDFVALGFPVMLTVTNAVEKLYIPLVTTVDVE